MGQINEIKDLGYLYHDCTNTIKTVNSGLISAFEELTKQAPVTVTGGSYVFILCLHCSHKQLNDDTHDEFTFINDFCCILPCSDKDTIKNCKEKLNQINQTSITSNSSSTDSFWKIMSCLEAF